MVRKPPSKLLKAKLITGLLLLSAISAFSQEWVKMDSITVSYKISSYAIDQEGKIYLGSTDGDIFRYDQEGNEDKVFSGINYSAVTTIEPWNRLKLFLFYRENQTIVYLDRFVATATPYQLHQLNIGFGSLATIGVDNSFWVLEARQNELRKYSNNKALLFSTPVNSINLEHASHIRAYQNLLILLDANKGFYFFDQFGNPVTEVSVTGARYFHIFNQQVITYDGKWIIEFDPFGPSSVRRINSPNDKFLAVLKTKNYYLFIKEQRVIKYWLK